VQVHEKRGRFTEREAEKDGRKKRIRAETKRFFKAGVLTKIERKAVIKRVKGVS
jgi:hypothetical protein